jgi:hypothetical protein
MTTPGQAPVASVAEAAERSHFALRRAVVGVAMGLLARSETAPGVAGEGRATDNGHLPADSTMTPTSTAHLADPALGEPPR